MIVYAGLEQVELDTLQGDDLVVVHSTAAGVTTRIRTGLGGDRVQVGGAIPAVNTGSATPVLPAFDPRAVLIAGPLYVTGGTGGIAELDLPLAVVLPGETATPPLPPPPPLVDVPEADLVDTLSINDSGGAAGHRHADVHEADRARHGRLRHRLQRFRGHLRSSSARARTASRSRPRSSGARSCAPAPGPTSCA